MLPSITIDLEFPPSVNAVWRSNRGRVHRSKEYTDWIAVSYGLWMQQRGAQKLKSIKGHYTLKIILNAPDNRQRDLDNLIKAPSDFLQSAGIIENDHLCRKLELVWCEDKDATYGARLIVSPWLTKGKPRITKECPGRL